jgi:hypothetical protein
MWSQAFQRLMSVPSSATCSYRFVYVGGKLYCYYILPFRGPLSLFSSCTHPSFTLVLCSQASRQVLGSTQPPIQWLKGLHPSVERPESGAGQSPTATVGGRGVNKAWNHISISPYILMPQEQLCVILRAE